MFEAGQVYQGEINPEQFLYIVSADNGGTTAQAQLRDAAGNLIEERSLSLNVFKNWRLIGAPKG